MSVICFANNNGLAIGDSQGFIREFFPKLPKSNYSDIKILVSSKDLKPSPYDQKNILTNTTLLSVKEAVFVREKFEQYFNLTPESRLTNALFEGWQERRVLFPNNTNRIFVAVFSQTNSNITEEWAFMSGGRQVIVRNRDQFGNGYDVEIWRGNIFEIRQFKNAKLDGLRITLSKDMEMEVYCRMKDGLAIGEYVSWDSGGGVSMHIKFKKPVDFFSWGWMPDILYEWKEVGP